MKWIAWALMLSAFSVLAEEWHAVDVWGYAPPRNSYKEPRAVVAPFPDTSSQISSMAFLTTTNAPEMTGNLYGGTITTEFEIRTWNSPVFFLHTSTPGLPPNVRLFFTTTTQPYRVDQANRNETAYWWTWGEWVCLAPGRYRLQAPVAAGWWSDALGHRASDPAYSPAFKAAASQVRQIGFSFGGGYFFDVGVGVTDPNTSAEFRILFYRVSRDRLTGRGNQATVY